MPKVALAETLVEWELLIASARKHAEGRPHLAELLDELQKRLDRAKALDIERHALRAKRQQATRDLENARDEGKELAIRTRSTLKAMFGLQHEGLVQFNIRPRRPYGKRKQKDGTGASPRKRAASRKTRRPPDPAEKPN